MYPQWKTVFIWVEIWLICIKIKELYKQKTFFFSLSQKFFVLDIFNLALVILKCKTYK